MTFRDLLRPLRGGAASLVAVAVLAACGGADAETPAPRQAADAAAPQQLAAAPQPLQTTVVETPAAGEGPVMRIYKTPTCGCCAAWVDHVKEAGFRVEVHDMNDVAPVKREHGLPGELASCHTAVVDGYVVEGHVPADVVQRMLREKPAIAGIAVPGMPRGSPGMEVPGGRVDPYDVMAFTKDGSQQVFESRP